jgi:hypothetical protein
MLGLPHVRIGLTQNYQIFYLWSPLKYFSTRFFSLTPSDIFINKFFHGGATPHQHPVNTPLGNPDYNSIHSNRCYD